MYVFAHTCARLEFTSAIPRAHRCVTARLIRLPDLHISVCVSVRAEEEEGGREAEGSSGLLLRLLCIIPNKQLITRVLNQGELASSGS